MQTAEGKLAYTFDEWCALRGISRGTAYNLEKRGQAPRMYFVGSRKFISVESDHEWVAAREAEADSKTRVDPKLSQMRRAIGAKGNKARIERIRARAR